MGNSSSVPLRLRRRRIDDPAALDLPFKSSGLYATCSWDDKHVRRLILRGDLAPRYPGQDDPSASVREECPICMLVYPVLNQTRCCQARLCTECYLQIRPPRHNKEPCPFCKYKRLEATCKGPRDAAELDREEMEQTNALQAIKRANAAVLSTDPVRNLSSPTQPLSSSATYADSPPSSSSPSCAEPSTSTSSLSPALESSLPAPTQSPSNSVSDTTSVPPSSLVATASSSTSESSSPSSSLPSPPRTEQCQQPHTCTEDHRTLFVSSYQQTATATDCIALETVVNGVNYHANAASDGKQPSPVSVQRTALLEDVETACNGSSDRAPSSQYGRTADRACGEARSLSRQFHFNRQSATSSSLHFDEEFEEEYVAMHEAIRRSLIEM